MLMASEGSKPLRSLLDLPDAALLHIFQYARGDTASKLASTCRTLAVLERSMRPVYMTARLLCRTSRRTKARDATWLPGCNSPVAAVKHIHMIARDNLQVLLVLQLSEWYARAAALHGYADGVFWLLGIKSPDQGIGLRNKYKVLYDRALVSAIGGAAAGLHADLLATLLVLPTAPFQPHGMCFVCDALKPLLLGSALIGQHPEAALTGPIRDLLRTQGVWMEEVKEFWLVREDRTSQSLLSAAAVRAAGGGAAQGIRQLMDMGLDLDEGTVDAMCAAAIQHDQPEVLSQVVDLKVPERPGRSGWPAGQAVHTVYKDTLHNRMWSAVNKRRLRCVAAMATHGLLYPTHLSNLLEHLGPGRAVPPSHIIPVMTRHVTQACQQHVLSALLRSGQHHQAIRLMLQHHPDAIMSAHFEHLVKNGHLLPVTLMLEHWDSGAPKATEVLTGDVLVGLLFKAATQHRKEVAAVEKEAPKPGNAVPTGNARMFHMLMQRLVTVFDCGERLEQVYMAFKTHHTPQDSQDPQQQQQKKKKKRSVRSIRDKHMSLHCDHGLWWKVVAAVCRMRRFDLLQAMLQDMPEQERRRMQHKSPSHVWHRETEEEVHPSDVNPLPSVAAVCAHYHRPDVLVSMKDFGVEQLQIIRAASSTQNCTFLRAVVEALLAQEEAECTAATRVDFADWELFDVPDWMDTAAHIEDRQDQDGSNVLHRQQRRSINLSLRSPPEWARTMVHSVARTAAGELTTPHHGQHLATPRQQADARAVLDMLIQDLCAPAIDAFLMPQSADYAVYNRKRHFEYLTWLLSHVNIPTVLTTTGNAAGHGHLPHLQWCRSGGGMIQHHAKLSPLPFVMLLLEHGAPAEHVIQGLVRRQKAVPEHVMDDLLNGYMPSLKGAQHAQHGAAASPQAGACATSCGDHADDKKRLRVVPEFSPKFLNDAVMRSLRTSRDVGIVKCLIAHGADGCRAVAYCADQGDFELFGTFLPLVGTPVSPTPAARDGRDQCALPESVILKIVHACVSSPRYKRVLELILAEDLIDPDAALMIVCEAGFWPPARFLVQSYGADPCYLLNQPVLSAAQNNHVCLVHYLIQQGACRDTALCGAAMGGHLDLFKVLVDLYGADVRHDEGAALQLACDHGQQHIAEYILSMF